MTHTPTKNSETLLPCPFCGGEAIEYGPGDGVYTCPYLNCPGGAVVEVIERWNTRAPERGEGQRTGIDWASIPAPKKTQDAFDEVWEEYRGEKLMRLFHEAAEFGAQYILSRQSAVGGDWEKELSDLVDEASGMESVTGAAAWVVSQAKKILRRALRCATRTPEGEEDHE